MERSYKCLRLDLKFSWYTWSCRFATNFTLLLCNSFLRLAGFASVSALAQRRDQGYTARIERQRKRSTRYKTVFKARSSPSRFAVPSLPRLRPICTTLLSAHSSPAFKLKANHPSSGNSVLTSLRLFGSRESRSRGGSRSVMLSTFKLV